MTHACRIALLVLGCLAIGPEDAPAQDPGRNELPNRYCPVMPKQRATAKDFLVYEGRTIHFCCADCPEEFLLFTNDYLGNLPAAPASASAPPLVGQEGAFDEEFGVPVLHRYRLWILLGCGFGVLAMLVRILVKTSKKRKLQPADWAMAGNAVLLGLLVGLGYRLLDFRETLQLLQDEEFVHYATYYDYGDPPIPHAPAVAPRLRATYYRGNDERSPHLHNGGNYRTATFHVSLVSAGQELDVGAEVRGKELGLRLIVERAPFTSDYYFYPRRMERVFLTRQSGRFMYRDGEAIEDAVPLNTVEPMQRWQADFPIGALRADERGCTGVVYVAEKTMLAGRFAGSRLHFGIEFDLRVADGRLREGSELRMGSLYVSRLMKRNRSPLTEWFDHEPIPELPRKPVLDDPELLGIREYEKEE